MKTTIFALIALLTMASFSNTLLARKTLYDLKRSPYAPELAHKIGDLLTIIVEETSSEVQNGNNSRETSAEHEFNLKKFFFPGFKLNQGFDDSMSDEEPPGLNVNFDNDFEGSASNNSSHIVTTKLQAQILEVVAPEQYIIQAKKILIINGKEKNFLITGTIREDDIEKDNTICSEMLANAYIEIDGEIASKEIEPNIISKIITTLF